MTRSIGVKPLAAAGIACLVFSLCGCFAEAERRARAEAEQARVVAEQARLAAEQARAEADRHAREWLPELQKTIQDCRRELDKVHKTTTEYDLVFATPEEGNERVKAHEARLAKMDRVQVHEVTVGYEQRDDKSLAGVAYERHFRASWVKDGRVIGVSYYSKKEVNGAAFVELLKTLFPIVNEDVSRHVTVKKGQ